MTTFKLADRDLAARMNDLARRVDLVVDSMIRRLGDNVAYVRVSSGPNYEFVGEDGAVIGELYVDWSGKDEPDIVVCEP